MSIRSILAPLDGDADNSTILQTALDLGQTFSAHVDALHVRADASDAVPMLGEGMSGDMIEDMISAADRAAAARAADVKDLFARLCAEHGVPQHDGPPSHGEVVSATWHEEVGREDEVVAWTGRLADVIVTARPGEQASPMRALSVHAALFETGRAVLALPPAPEHVAIGRDIAIAWNGTAQAARAVHAAMPFIVRAGKVRVLTCESERTDPSAADELARYLEWWGVTADVSTFPPAKNKDTIGETVLARAQDSGADMLVSGAYAHSRLMQMVLGGVTSAIMDDANIPVLLSH